MESTYKWLCESTVQVHVSVNVECEDLWLGVLFALCSKPNDVGIRIVLSSLDSSPSPPSPTSLSPSLSLSLCWPLIRTKPQIMVSLFNVIIYKYHVIVPQEIACNATPLIYST